MPLMKFFTLANWKKSQNLDDDKAFAEVVTADKKYRLYLETIRSKLPPEFQRFLELASLDDGEVLEIEIEPSLAKASLWCRALDNASEGKNAHYLTLEYYGLRKFRSLAPEQESFGGDGYGDIGNQEIELLSEGTFEHRLLFSTGIELAITFVNFKLVQLPWSELRESSYGKWRKLL